MLTPKKYVNCECIESDIVRRSVPFTSPPFVSRWHTVRALRQAVPALHLAASAPEGPSGPDDLPDLRQDHQQGGALATTYGPGAQTEPRRDRAAGADPTTHGARGPAALKLLLNNDQQRANYS